MWSGDSLNIVLWLGGVAIAAVMGAIAAPIGWRSKTLWWIALVFGLATLGWIATPTASPLIRSITPVAVTIATSNALFMVIVVGVVALMVGGRPAPVQPQSPQEDIGDPAIGLPAFAVHSTTRWTPDFTFENGIGYLVARSNWRDPYGMNMIDAATTTLTEALAANKITAWGREHPNEGELFEIAQRFWVRADVTLDTGYAFSHRLGTGAYDVHLSQKEMEHIWPPKDR